MGTVSRVHTFSSGAVLTAAQLNTEFDNLLTSSAINGGLNATNLGVTAGQVTASKALVVDSSRDLDDTTSSNMLNNLTLSGTLKLLDNKSLTLGTDSNITVQYDETTNDALEIAAAVEGAALGIVLKADQGDDAGDEWKLNVADGGTLTLGNDIASAGTYVSGLTITPHATTASWLLDFEGDVDVGGDTLSFNGAATIDTSGNNNLTLSAGTATLGVTAGDVTVYDDNNNADTSLSIGTSATEALVVQALNGGSNKTLEELRFTTKTASGTANHGKYALYVDEAHIADVDDSGINLASGKTFRINGTSVISGLGDFSGPGSSTDNAIVRFDGTGGKTGQTSSVLIDDSNNVSGIGTLAAGATTISGDTVVANGYHLVVGHSAPINIGSVGELQVLGTAAGDTEIAAARFSANSGGPSFAFLKSRNGSIGSSTIVQNGDELGGVIWYSDDGNDFYSSSARIFAAVDGTPGENDVPGRLIFATTADGANSSTERWRITNTGQLTPSSGALGDISYININTSTNAYAQPKVTFASNTSSSASTSGEIRIHQEASPHSDYRAFVYSQSSSNTQVFRVMGDGNCENANNSYGSTSDLKLKQDITDARSYWDNFKALQFKKFRFKKDVAEDENAGYRFGLIAQDVESIFPSLVRDNTDLDLDGTPTDTVTKSIKYSVLSQIGLRVVQELQTRLEAAEAKIAALEAA